MELIGSHQVLRPLADLSLDGRQQLRRHGGVQNVLQHVVESLILLRVVPGQIGHQVPHQRLGDGGVDGIVAHVVAVVGAPAQGQLAQVPGADHQAAGLVGNVHQHLGPLPGLAVFKGDVVVLHALADVGEVAAHRLGDVHHLQRGAHPLRQQLRVGAGPGRGAEAGHGDGDDVAGGPVQHPHGQGGDQQGQGGVQAAGEAHHRRSGIGVLQALFEAQRGDPQDLLAPLRPTGIILRHKGGGGDVPGQAGLLRRQGERNPPDLRRLLADGEGVGSAAVVDQPVHVDLTDGETGGEPPLRQQGAVFRDQVVAGEHHVGGRLSLAGVGVHIAAHQPGGLARHQGAAVVRLPHQLIGGGEVQNHSRALPGQLHGGGRRSPQVLADLHPDHQVWHGVAGEGLVRTKAHMLSAQLDPMLHAMAGGEPPLLIKLPVIGQISLGDQPQNLSILYNSSAVIQFVIPFIPNRQPQGRHDVQIPGGLQDRLEALLGTPEQGVLQKQVAAGVAGEAQLRQGQDLHALLVRLPHEGKDLLRVIAAVRHPDLRGAGGHGDKTVFHF